jgi:hypothetical protein
MTQEQFLKKWYRGYRTESEMRYDLNKLELEINKNDTETQINYNPTNNFRWKKANIGLSSLQQKWTTYNQSGPDMWIDVPVVNPDQI